MEKNSTDQDIEDFHESTITLEEHLRRYSDKSENDEDGFSDIRNTQDYKDTFEFIVNGVSAGDLKHIDADIAKKTWWDIVSEYSGLTNEIRQRAGEVVRESAKEANKNSSTIINGSQSVVINGLKSTIEDARNEEWMSLARCKNNDTDMFFPTRGVSELEAKQLCSRCEVNENCLKYALDRDIRHGIWGGLNEKERGRLRRLRKKK